MEKWRQNELISKYLSGTDEEHSEIQDLCTEIDELMVDHVLKKRDSADKATEKAERLKEMGKCIRDAAMFPKLPPPALDESSSETSPSSSPSSSPGHPPTKKRKKLQEQLRTEKESKIEMQSSIAQYFSAKAELMRAQAEALKKESERHDEWDAMSENKNFFMSVPLSLSPSPSFKRRDKD